MSGWCCRPRCCLSRTLAPTSSDNDDNNRLEPSPSTPEVEPISIRIDSDVLDCPAAAVAEASADEKVSIPPSPSGTPSPLPVECFVTTEYAEYGPEEKLIRGIITVRPVASASHTNVSNDEEKTVDNALRISFAIDTSDSMRSHNKFLYVAESLAFGIGKLRPGQSVAVTAFNHDAKTIQPMVVIQSEQHRQEIAKRVYDAAMCAPGGFTDLTLGVQRALEQFGDAHTDGDHLVLLTDGMDFSSGTPRTEEELSARILALKHIRAITCHVIAVGHEKMNEQMLDTLTDGGGSLVHVAHPSQIPAAFGRVLGCAASVVAHKVTVGIELATPSNMLKFVRDVSDADSSATSKQARPSMAAPNPFSTLRRGKIHTCIYVGDVLAGSELRYAFYAPRAVFYMPIKLHLHCAIRRAFVESSTPYAWDGPRYATHTVAQPVVADVWADIAADELARAIRACYVQPLEAGGINAVANVATMIMKRVVAAKAQSQLTPQCVQLARMAAKAICYVLQFADDNRSAMPEADYDQLSKLHIAYGGLSLASCACGETSQLHGEDLLAVQPSSLMLRVLSRATTMHSSDADDVLHLMQLLNVCGPVVKTTLDEGTKVKSSTESVTSAKPATPKEPAVTAANTDGHTAGNVLARQWSADLNRQVSHVAKSWTVDPSLAATSASAGIGQVSLVRLISTR